MTATRTGRVRAPAEQQHPVGSKCRDTCQRPTQSQAHCSVCHVTLGGPWAFDRHRRGGECVDPASLGLVERAGVWREPMDDAALDRKRAFRVAAAAADGRTGPGAYPSEGDAAKHGSYPSPAVPR
jgi:hypothetical protein